MQPMTINHVYEVLPKHMHSALQETFTSMAQQCPTELSEGEKKKPNFLSCSHFAPVQKFSKITTNKSQRYEMKIKYRFGCLLLH